MTAHIIGVIGSMNRRAFVVLEEVTGMSGIASYLPGPLTARQFLPVPSPTTCIEDWRLPAQSLRVDAPPSLNLLLLLHTLVLLDQSIGKNNDMITFGVS